MFDKYSDKIRQLENFDKANILCDDFKLYSDGLLSIFYAPHNEIINKDAKIFIVGITPGWTQTCIAYKTASRGLNEKLPVEQIKKECKRNSRFAGSMRKNIIAMLDELNVHEYLGISSCEALFSTSEYLLHTTSVIPYPVFINGKNYTGFQPKILNNDILKSYVKKYFYQEALSLPNALYIPLGKAVEEVLKMMIDEKILKEEQCLMGFPHPSGANGHRLKQFNLNKDDLALKVKKFFTL